MRMKILFVSILIFVLAAAVVSKPFFTGTATEPFSENVSSQQPAEASTSDYRAEEWPMAFHDLRHTGYTSAFPPSPLENAVKLKWSFTTGSWIYSSPAIVDIDNDGSMEVVFGSSDENLYALSGENGDLEWVFSADNVIWSSPAVVETENGKRVFFGSRGGKFFALNADNGDLAWSATLEGEVVSSPAAADIDNDGVVEVLIGSEGIRWGAQPVENGKLYAFTADNGGIEWIYTADSPIHHSVPAIADLDTDGGMEVIVSSWAGTIYDILGENGQLSWSNDVALDSPAKYPTSYSSASILDVDGNGVLDVMLGTDENSIFLYMNSNALRDVIPLPNQVRTVPSFADLDNDGNLELVVGLHEGENSGGGIVSIAAENGQINWINEFDGPSSSTPAIADIDGDGAIEVMIGNDDGNLYCFNGKTGELEWKYSTGGVIRSSPVIADVDNDRVPEILIGSYDNSLYVLSLG